MLPQKHNRENNQTALGLVERTTRDLLESFKTRPLLLFTGTPKIDLILLLYLCHEHQRAGKMAPPGRKELPLDQDTGHEYWVLVPIPLNVINVPSYVPLSSKAPLSSSALNCSTGMKL